MSLARNAWGDPSRPALVCLHGVTSQGRHFEQLAGRMEDRFHVVALDLRGHGASTGAPPWHLEQPGAAVVGSPPPRPAICTATGTTANDSVLAPKVRYT